VIVLFTVAYVLLLFWLKLNIIQTMLILGAMAVPAGLIVYRALRNITIEV
jgi:hypothetical protein